MRYRIILLLSALCVVLLAAAAWKLAGDVELQDLKDQADDSLSLKRYSILTEINNFRSQPFSVAMDDRIRELLREPRVRMHMEVTGLKPEEIRERVNEILNEPSVKAHVDVANRHLEDLNDEAKSMFLYVLNMDGLCVASSNWKQATSFVGSNYSDRPYYRQAVGGAEGIGHFYAVGKNTKLPGFHWARRIEDEAGNAGVAVVKLDLTKLSTAWAAARERVGVVDQAGMIFLSSVKEWEFTPLTPLSQADIERILAEKQYKSEHISKASILQTGTDLQSDVYLEVQGNTVLLRFMEIPEFGWRIFSAYDVGPINQFAYLAAATVFLCAALLFVLAFYLVERRQRSRANQMREILENVNAGIAVFDSDLHLLSWNNKYLQLNSYPESLILPGRALSEIINYNILKGDFGPGDPKALLQQRLDRIRKHAIRKTEVRRSDGTWLEIVRSRVPNGTLITTYTDVTERKVQAERLDAQVKERTAELHKTIEEVSVARRIAEQASLAKTSFMDSIVHEIKNPLNAILGYANLLLSGAKDKLPEKQYQNLQKLYASGWELNELADDFLEYSRADQVTVSEFALAQLIDKCLRNLEPRIHDRRIQVECDVPEDLPRLNQDERKLRSVVNNLLSNAEKYTEAGSIKVTVRRRSDLVEISVTDTGVGIADEYRQLIFDEYKRIPSSDGRTRPGTGLGLAICRRFATLMGGAIDLKSSSLGSGSTFIVSIPMIHPQTTRAAAKVASALPLTTTNESQGTGLNDERPTILIVDDSQENRDILAQLLGGAHRILLAEDGSKAIQLADLEHPDLIFMDLSLPIVSGWEATRTIKRKSQIPIIAVTAHTSEQDRNDARAAGCDDVLPKPIDQFAIHDALRRFLRPSPGIRR